VPNQSSDPVERQVEAYNLRDLDAFISCYSPDVVIEDATGIVVMQGHEARRRVYGDMFGQSPELHAEIPTRIRIGEYVIDEELVTGLRGSPDEIRVAVIYHVSGDVIDGVQTIR
jgi:hypothetical protein